MDGSGTLESPKGTVSRRAVQHWAWRSQAERVGPVYVVCLFVCLFMQLVLNTLCKQVAPCLVLEEGLSFPARCENSWKNYKANKQTNQNKSPS